MLWAGLSSRADLEKNLQQAEADGARLSFARNNDPVSIPDDWFLPKNVTGDAMDNDIAVIHLSEPFNMTSSRVKLATLFVPRNLDEFSSSIPSLAMGWGHYMANDSSHDLREARFNTVSGQHWVSLAKRVWIEDATQSYFNSLRKQIGTFLQDVIKPKQQQENIDDLMARVESRYRTIVGPNLTRTIIEYRRIKRSYSRNRHYVTNYRRRINALELKLNTDMVYACGERVGVLPNDEGSPRLSQGDAGGPLFIRNQNGFVQLAVTVGGAPCTKFTRIANHIDFIREAVGPHAELRITEDMEPIDSSTALPTQTNITS